MLCDNSEWCAFLGRGWKAAHACRHKQLFLPRDVCLYAYVSTLTACVYVDEMAAWCFMTIIVCVLVTDISSKNVEHLFSQQLKSRCCIYSQTFVCMCLTHRQWTTVRPSPHSLCHFCTWASKLRKAFLESGTSLYADQRKNWNWHTTRWPSCS